MKANDLIIPSHILAITIVLFAPSLMADSRLYGPVPYVSFSNSPFNGISFTQFYLEDFEDGLFNTPGVTAINNNPGGSSLCIYGPGGATDSVDEDDGIIDGSGLNGHELSACSNDGGDNYGTTFIFDKDVLGVFPTHVGIVWTDGSKTAKTKFEAFDASGNSLGVIGPVKISDDSFLGTTSEDRFFGASNTDGISKITLRDPTGYNTLSIDHLQYGMARNSPTQISGGVNGLSSLVMKATCTNITTGNTIPVKVKNGAAQWTCDNTGLVINAGDSIKINLIATGTAK